MKMRMMIATAAAGVVASVGVLLAGASAERAQQGEAGGGAVERRLARRLSVQREARGARRAEPDADAPPQGIQGHVINALGAPAVGVTVVARSAVRGPLTYSATDEQGQFSFRLPAGTYEVYAREKGGPHSPNADFYTGGGGAVREVNVGEGQVASDVVVNMPPKYGKLIGRVVDAETGTPLAACDITLRRVDNPDFYLLTGPNEKGDFAIPVPTAPITVEVSAEGYEGKRLGVMRLKGGEKKPLTISLRPAN